jgi:hypothetical protein
MEQDATEQTVGVMLDPLALRALDGQLHDEVDDLDALNRARAAVGVALQSLNDRASAAETPVATASIGINARVVGVSACAGLGIGTVVGVIFDTSELRYRVHFDGQPTTANYLCRPDHISAVASLSL